MQCITTKYIGPSHTRGSRIKARCAAGSLTIGYDDALSAEEDHQECARQLARGLEWAKHQRVRFLVGVDHQGNHQHVICENRGGRLHGDWTLETPEVEAELKAAV